MAQCKHGAHPMECPEPDCVAEYRNRGWYSIETAPKGKIILLFAVTARREDGSVANWKMATGHTPFSGPVEWTWDGWALKEWDVLPTHWQPLPEPPADGGK